MPRPFRIRPIPTLATTVGVGLLLSLGTWQANRYFEKAAIEATQAERATLPPVPVTNASGLLDPEHQYRFVDAHGSIDTSRTVVFKFRTLNGKSGVWLASPLILPDHNAVLVLRGWVDVKDGMSLAKSQQLPDSGIYRGLLYSLPRNIVDDLTRASLPQDPVDSFVAWNTFDVEGVYAFWKLPVADDQLVLVLTEGDPGPPLESADHITQPYMTADKHMGYSLTWYTLGACLLALWAAAGFGFIGSRPNAAPRA